MRATRHLVQHLGLLVGMAIVSISLLGCLTLPDASVSGVVPTGYQAYQDDWDDWGPWSHWGYRHDRPYWRPRYALPDRYTIHKGKKCELRCERIWGTRDYRCREYRC
jgi:hypothetical protein